MINIVKIYCPSLIYLLKNISKLNFFELSILSNHCYFLHDTMAQTFNPCNYNQSNPYPVAFFLCISPQLTMHLLNLLIHISLGVVHITIKRAAGCAVAANFI